MTFHLHNAIIFSERGVFMNIEIRYATVNDAEEILAIYSPYVENTAVSFEYEPPAIEEFRDRIRNTLEKFPYLVAVSDGEIIGYTYAGQFHPRAAFLHSAELSVYLRQDMRGKGIGRKLYSEMEKLLKAKGFINLYALVAYADEEDEYISHDSVIFHEVMGYKTVGKCNKCGFKFGRWYDMLYMEKFIGQHK